MINPSRTRWLVLHPCVVRLLDNKVPLQEFFTLMALEDKKDAEAAEILDLLRNPIIHANLLFLKYTLQYFNKMNALFQTEDIMIHKLKEVSLTYLKQLCQNYMRPNVLPSVVTIDVTHPHFQVPLEKVYLGPGLEEALKDIPLPNDPGKSEIQLVQMRENEIKTFRLRCLDFYVTAAKEMKTYLPLSNKIVDEAKYIEPEVALSVEARTDLPDLRNSLSNFKVPHDLDIDAAVVEWREMPYTLENEAAWLRVLKPAEFWFEVGKMRDFCDKPVFPELSKLAKVTLALPHSNASAERTFSVVTDTKTNKRNKMKNKTLDSICVVRSAMKRKKETCFDLQVRKEHLDKHNKTMYNV
ncbi:CTP synthase [Frankliniella fusca]|uniref:CTP synthase n=1 Tax=Frankliniella fusca TaxID=407009 RepID=A0AAE1LQ83_9NEOP|nr:CTP synthase [Frankliniella fusca]